MIKAKKSLSQNFLIDKNISNKIINQTIIKNKTILEIGPGYGFLTDSILKNNPNKVYLIEKDYNLYNYLKEKYKNNNKITLVCEDILKYNLNDFKNIIIISNLPYNISTKVILYLFNYNKIISEMLFMVQKEVALKFDYSLPKMNKYKFLTYIVSEYSRCFDISPNVFKPRPKVKSTVVKFKIHEKNINLKKAYKFSNLIFKNVRKKIIRNIQIETKNELFEKRINQLSINDLLKIYNFF